MVKKENDQNKTNSLLRTAANKRLGASRLALYALRSGVRPPIKRVHVKSGESRVSDLTASVASDTARPAVIKEISVKNIEIDSSILGMSENSSSFSLTKAYEGNASIGMALKTTPQPKANQPKSFVLPPFPPAGGKNVKKTSMELQKGIKLSAPSPMSLDRVAVQMGQEKVTPESKDYKLRQEQIKKQQIEELKKLGVEQKKYRAKLKLEKESARHRGEGFEAQLEDFQDPADPTPSAPIKKKSLVKKLLGKMKTISPKKKTSDAKAVDSTKLTESRNADESAEKSKPLNVEEARELARKAIDASRKKRNTSIQGSSPTMRISKTGNLSGFPISEILTQVREDSISDLDASARRFPINEVVTKEAHQARDDDTISTLGTPHIFERMDRLAARNKAEQREGVVVGTQKSDNEQEGKNQESQRLATPDGLPPREGSDESRTRHRHASALVDQMDSGSAWSVNGDPAAASAASADTGAIEVVMGGGCDVTREIEDQKEQKNGQLVVRNTTNPAGFALASMCVSPHLSSVLASHPPKKPNTVMMENLNVQLPLALDTQAQTLLTGSQRPDLSSPANNQMQALVIYNAETKTDPALPKTPLSPTSAFTNALDAAIRDVETKMKDPTATDQQLSAKQMQSEENEGEPRNQDMVMLVDITDPMQSQTGIEVEASSNQGLDTAALEADTAQKSSSKTEEEGSRKKTITVTVPIPEPSINKLLSPIVEGEEALSPVEGRRTNDLPTSQRYSLNPASPSQDADSAKSSSQNNDFPFSSASSDSSDESQSQDTLDSSPKQSKEGSQKSTSEGSDRDSIPEFEGVDSMSGVYKGDSESEERTGDAANREKGAVEFLPPIKSVDGGGIIDLTDFETRSGVRSSAIEVSAIDLTNFATKSDELEESAMLLFEAKAKEHLTGMKDSRSDKDGTAKPDSDQHAKKEDRSLLSDDSNSTTSDDGESLSGADTENCESDHKSKGDRRGNGGSGTSSRKTKSKGTSLDGKKKSVGSKIAVPPTASTGKSAFHFDDFMDITESRLASSTDRGLPGDRYAVEGGSAASGSKEEGFPNRNIQDDSSKEKTLITVNEECDSNIEVTYMSPSSESRETKEELENDLNIEVSYKSTSTPESSGSNEQLTNHNQSKASSNSKGSEEQSETNSNIEVSYKSPPASESKSGESKNVVLEYHQAKESTKSTEKSPSMMPGMGSEPKTIVESEAQIEKKPEEDIIVISESFEARRAQEKLAKMKINEFENSASFEVYDIAEGDAVVCYEVNRFGVMQEVSPRSAESGAFSPWSSVIDKPNQSLSKAISGTGEFDNEQAEMFQKTIFGESESKESFQLASADKGSSRANSSLYSDHDSRNTDEAYSQNAMSKRTGRSNESNRSRFSKPTPGDMRDELSVTQQSKDTRRSRTQGKGKRDNPTSPSTQASNDFAGYFAHGLFDLLSMDETEDTKPRLRDSGCAPFSEGFGTNSDLEEHSYARKGRRDARVRSDSQDDNSLQGNTPEEHTIHALKVRNPDILDSIFEYSEKVICGNDAEKFQLDPSLLKDEEIDIHCDTILSFTGDSIRNARDAIHASKQDAIQACSPTARASEENGKASAEIVNADDASDVSASAAIKKDRAEPSLGVLCGAVPLYLMYSKNAPKGKSARRKKVTRPAKISSGRRHPSSRSKEAKKHLDRPMVEDVVTSDESIESTVDDPLSDSAEPFGELSPQSQGEDEKQSMLNSLERVDGADQGRLTSPPAAVVENLQKQVSTQTPLKKAQVFTETHTAGESPEKLPSPQDKPQLMTTKGESQVMHKVPKSEPPVITGEPSQSKISSKPSKKRPPPTPEGRRSHERVLLDKHDAYWDTLSTIASTTRDRSSDNERAQKVFAKPGPIPIEITMTNKTSSSKTVPETRGASSMNNLNSLIGEATSDSSLSHSLADPAKMQVLKESTRGSTTQASAQAQGKSPKAAREISKRQESATVDGQKQSKTQEGISESSDVAGLITRHETSSAEAEKESQSSGWKSDSKRGSEFTDDSGLILAVTRSEVEDPETAGTSDRGGNMTSDEATDESLGAESMSTRSSRGNTNEASLPRYRESSLVIEFSATTSTGTISGPESTSNTTEAQDGHKESIALMKSSMESQHESGVSVPMIIHGARGYSENESSSPRPRNEAADGKLRSQNQGAPTSVQSIDSNQSSSIFDERNPYVHTGMVIHQAKPGFAAPSPNKAQKSEELVESHTQSARESYSGRKSSTVLLASTSISTNSAQTAEEQDETPNPSEDEESIEEASANSSERVQSDHKESIGHPGSTGHGDISELQEFDTPSDSELEVNRPQPIHGEKTEASIGMQAASSLSRNTIETPQPSDTTGTSNGSEASNAMREVGTSQTTEPSIAMEETTSGASPNTNAVSSQPTSQSAEDSTGVQVASSGASTGIQASSSGGTSSTNISNSQPSSTLPSTEPSITMEAVTSGPMLSVSDVSNPQQSGMADTSQGTEPSIGKETESRGGMPTPQPSVVMSGTLQSEQRSVSWGHEEIYETTEDQTGTSDDVHSEAGDSESANQNLHGPLFNESEDQQHPDPTNWSSDITTESEELYPNESIQVTAHADNQPSESGDQNHNNWSYDITTGPIEPDGDFGGDNVTASQNMRQPGDVLGNQNIAYEENQHHGNSSSRSRSNSTGTSQRSVTWGFEEVYEAPRDYLPGDDLIVIAESNESKEKEEGGYSSYVITELLEVGHGADNEELGHQDSAAALIDNREEDVSFINNSHEGHDNDKQNSIDYVSVERQTSHPSASHSYGGEERYDYNGYVGSHQHPGEFITEGDHQWINEIQPEHSRDRIEIERESSLESKLHGEMSLRTDSHISLQESKSINNLPHSSSEKTLRDGDLQQASDNSQHREQIPYDADNAVPKPSIVASAIQAFEARRASAAAVKTNLIEAGQHPGVFSTSTASSQEYQEQVDEQAELNQATERLRPQCTEELPTYEHTPSEHEHEERTGVYENLQLLPPSSDEQSSGNEQISSAHEPYQKVNLGLTLGVDEIQQFSRPNKGEEEPQYEQLPPDREIIPSHEDVEFVKSTSDSDILGVKDEPFLRRTNENDVDPAEMGRSSTNAALTESIEDTATETSTDENNLSEHPSGNRNSPIAVIESTSSELEDNSEAMARLDYRSHEQVANVESIESKLTRTANWNAIGSHTYRQVYTQYTPRGDTGLATHQIYDMSDPQMEDPQMGDPPGLKNVNGSIADSSVSTEEVSVERQLSKNRNHEQRYFLADSENEAESDAVEDTTLHQEQIDSQQANHEVVTDSSDEEIAPANEIGAEADSDSIEQNETYRGNVIESGGRDSGSERNNSWDQTDLYETILEPVSQSNRLDPSGNYEPSMQTEGDHAMTSEVMHKSSHLSDSSVSMTSPYVRSSRNILTSQHELGSMTASAEENFDGDFKQVATTESTTMGNVQGKEYSTSSGSHDKQNSHRQTYSYIAIHSSEHKTPPMVVDGSPVIDLVDKETNNYDPQYAKNSATSEIMDVVEGNGDIMDPKEVVHKEMEPCDNDLQEMGHTASTGKSEDMDHDSSQLKYAFPAACLIPTTGSNLSAIPSDQENITMASPGPNNAANSAQSDSGAEAKTDLSTVVNERYGAVKPHDAEEAIELSRSSYERNEATSNSQTIGNDGMDTVEHAIEVSRSMFEQNSVSSSVLVRSDSTRTPTDAAVIKVVGEVSLDGSVRSTDLVRSNSTRTPTDAAVHRVGEVSLDGSVRSTGPARSNNTKTPTDAAVHRGGEVSLDGSARSTGLVQSLKRMWDTRAAVHAEESSMMSRSQQRYSKCEYQNIAADMMTGKTSFGSGSSSGPNQVLHQEQDAPASMQDEEGYGINTVVVARSGSSHAASVASGVSNDGSAAARGHAAVSAARGGSRAAVSATSGGSHIVSATSAPFMNDGVKEAVRSDSRASGVTTSHSGANNDAPSHFSASGITTSGAATAVSSITALSKNDKVQTRAMPYGGTLRAPLTVHKASTPLAVHRASSPVKETIQGANTHKVERELISRSLELSRVLVGSLNARNVVTSHGQTAEQHPIRDASEINGSESYANREIINKAMSQTSSNDSGNAGSSENDGTSEDGRQRGTTQALKPEEVAHDLDNFVSLENGSPIDVAMPDQSGKSNMASKGGQALFNGGDSEGSGSVELIDCTEDGSSLGSLPNVPASVMVRAGENHSSQSTTKEKLSTISAVSHTSSEESTVDVNTLFARYDNLANDLIEQNNHLKMAALRNKLKRAASRSTNSQQLSESNNTPEVLNKLDELRLQRDRALARFEKASARNPDEEEREQAETPRITGDANQDRGGHFSADSSVASSRRERDHVRYYALEANSLRSVDKSSIASSSSRSFSTGRQYSASRFVSALDQNRALSAERRRVYDERDDTGDNESMSSSSDSTATNTTTPSAKARDLRRQLDEALVASKAIRQSQEKLGKELRTFKQRFYNKNNNSLEDQAIRAINQYAGDLEESGRQPE